jgi:hypothetical protein
MLRYKALLPPYGNAGWIVRDMIKQHDIATCKEKADANKITHALNFVHDWEVIPNAD